MRDDAEADLLVYNGVPGPAPGQDPQQQPARTTQRRDQALHRRGGHISNEAAVVRSVGVLLLEQHDEWAI